MHDAETQHGIASVIDLKISAGEVQAQVMGTDLYKIEVSVAAVPARQWKAIGTDCSGSIDSPVELLQGKLFTAVMERICKPGTGLFPVPKDIKFSCSCTDWASMSKHVAAVLCGVGTRLDEQPELLFTLRRVNAKDLVTQASAGFPKPKKATKASKVLDDSALGDVFGIEMAEPVLAKPKPRGKAVAEKTEPVRLATGKAKVLAQRTAKEASKVPVRKRTKAFTPACASGDKSTTQAKARLVKPKVDVKRTKLQIAGSQ